jgi:Domain of unknown function (DUF4340)
VQKRLITNLLLLIVVGVLTSVFILSDKQVDEVKTALLSNIDAAGIEHITVRQSSKEDIIFNRQGQQWFVTSPVHAIAHTSRVNAILHLLKSRSFAQIDVEDNSLEIYQLDPAILSLRMNSHEFFFGTTEPIDDRRYVMFDNTIHLVTDHLFHQLRQPPMFFVSPRLVPEREIISSIQFNDQIISKVNNSWTMLPTNNAVSTEHLGSLVQQWQKAEARQILQYQGADAEEKVILKYKSARTAYFDVISKTPNLILGRADLSLQYNLDRTMAERLLVVKSNPEVN